MSLYQIEQELHDLFVQIEENDGEITEEQYDYLLIKQEELAKKLNNYRKAVAVWEGSLNACKKEESRLKDVRNRLNNRVDRLKRIMLLAVEKFGETNKSVKYIELPDCRLSTRRASSIEINESRETTLANEFMRVVSELHNNDIFDVNEFDDGVGIIDTINANVVAENPDHEDFTTYDLLTKCNVVIECTLWDLLVNHHELMGSIAKSSAPISIKSAMSKTDYKELLDMVSGKDIGITTAESIQKTSLTIK